MRAVGAESVPAELRDRYLDQGWWHATTVRAGLEAHAGRTPERLAVSDATARWTYADLERAVATTLGGLRRHGVGDGSPVLVIAPLIAPAVAA
jgi:2,3-dihydroxybenzoate-AMP ligase